MHMCACMHTVPMKFRRGHQILWVWSFLWLRTASFGFWELNWDPLGTEPRAAAIFTSWEDHLSSLHQKACRSSPPLLDCSYTTTVVWGQDCHTSILLFSSDNPLVHFPVWLRGSVTLTLLSSLENEQTQPHQHELAASLVLTSSSGDYFVCVCNALARVRRSDIAPPSHSLPCSSSLNTAVSRRWCEGRGVWPWLQSLGSKWGQQSTWHPGPSVSRHRWWQIWSSLKMCRAYITI